MVSASDLADWWDTQNADYNELVGRFVDENPQWWAVGLATAATIPTGLGAGLVDVLRLGKGFAEGGVGGAVQDVLRLISLLGPVARVAKFATLGASARLARLLSDQPGGVCTWMAATKALRQVGASPFALVEDLAKMWGKPIPTGSGLPSVWAEELAPALRMLGAKVTALAKASTLNEVLSATRSGNNVILFSIKWKMNGVEVGHTLYAFRDFIGRVLIADRTGAVVRQLSELEKFYPGIGGAEIFTTAQGGAMMLVEGAKLLIPAGSAYAALVMPVFKLTVLNSDSGASMDEIKAAFETFKDLQTNPQQFTKTIVNLPPVEWLTGVQTRLNELGFQAGPVNNIFSKQTKDAVINFQKKYGLRSDGIPGPLTQARLKTVFGA